MDLRLPTRAVALKSAELIVSAAAVTAALEKMAAAINDTYRGSSPMLYGVMLGGLVPLVRLMRRLVFPHTVDYLHATRYRGGTTGGEL